MLIPLVPFFAIGALGVFYRLKATYDEQMDTLVADRRQASAEGSSS